jgi:hypothetical protein
MSNLFGNFNDDPRIQRQALANKYSAARSNLILMVIFSAINLLMLATNAGTYFLFSASVPYIITDVGMFFCGMYPTEAYEGFEGMYFLDKSLFFILLAISALILVIYFLCWLFSKNGKVKWLTTALVLFCIDTLVMFVYYGFAISSIIDIIFHVWVIVILVMGIKAHKKLKEMPEEEVVIEAEYRELPADGEEIKEDLPHDSTPIRHADTDTKVRVLLETDYFNHTITYRRVKTTNELVIDGKVYDEYTALIETAHILTAVVDGHNIAAGMDNTSRSFINVDGQTVKTKLRLI